MHLCRVFCMFLSYSAFGCLQSKILQNSWKWFAISPITKSGVRMIGKTAGVDSFISDLRTVNNTPTLSLCSSSIKRRRLRWMHVGVSYAQSDWVFCKRTEFTSVALHLGVFQGIVKSSGKHYGKVYRKL